MEPRRWCVAAPPCRCHQPHATPDPHAAAGGLDLCLTLHTEAAAALEASHGAAHAGHHSVRVRCVQPPPEWGAGVPLGGVEAELTTRLEKAGGRILLLRHSEASEAAGQELPLHARCMRAAALGAVAVLVVPDALTPTPAKPAAPAKRGLHMRRHSSAGTGDLHEHMMRSGPVARTAAPICAVPVAMTGRDAVPALLQASQSGERAVLTAGAGLWLAGDRIRVLQACAGRGVTVVCTRRGAVLACGKAAGGRLGLGDVKVDVPALTLLPGLATMPVVQLTVVGSTCFAVTADGRVLTWGQNGHTNDHHRSPREGAGQATDASEACAETCDAGTAKCAHSSRLACLVRSARRPGKMDGTPMGFGGTDTWDRLAPCELPALRGRRITCVAAGEHHALAIDAEGRVFAWGRGKHGQLGLGRAEDRSMPTQVRAQDFPSQPVSAAAGSSHSMVVCAGGEVVVFGSGKALGLGRRGSGVCATPRLLGALAGQRVVGASTHCDAVLAWTREGALFAWGANPSPGLLATGDTHPRWEPTLVTALGDAEVVQACLAPSLALAVTRGGALWSWGAGARTGHGGRGQQRTPRVVDALRCVRVASASASEAHVTACTVDGDLYAWGKATQGRLGLGEEVREEEVRVPRRVGWEGMRVL